MTRLAVAAFAAALAVVLLCGISTARADPPPAGAKPVVCTVGIAINDIGVLDFAASSYKLHGLVWMNWVGAWEDCALLPVNADEGSLQELLRRSEGDHHYRLMRIKGSFMADYELRRYPFDEQSIEVDLENPLRTTGELDISPEPAVERGGPAPGLARDLSVPGWSITGAAVDEKTHVYKNGLGTAKPASYERFIYRVTLQRTSVGYVVKVLLPLSVIAAVVFLGFLLPPTRIDVSVGLVVTCLLATIALHLTQSSSMPSVGFLVAGDYAFMVAYLLLVFALLERIVSFHYSSKGSEDLAKRLNRIAVVVFPLTYVGAIALILLHFTK